ncbi:MAG: hypothetical protein JSS89_12085 [Bacteroidetes bacterium]|nr:hypothetical protein [Bacteroidota bacterium]
MTHTDILTAVYRPKTHKPCTNAAEYRFVIEMACDRASHSSESSAASRPLTRASSGYVCSRCAHELMAEAQRSGREVVLQKISIETECTIAIPIDIEWPRDKSADHSLHHQHTKGS